MYVYIEEKTYFMVRKLKKKDVSPAEPWSKKYFSQLISFKKYEKYSNLF